MAALPKLYAPVLSLKFAIFCRTPRKFTIFLKPLRKTSWRGAITIAPAEIFGNLLTPLPSDIYWPPPQKFSSTDSRLPSPLPEKILKNFDPFRNFPFTIQLRNFNMAHSEIQIPFGKSRQQGCVDIKYLNGMAPRPQLVLNLIHSAKVCMNNALYVPES
jgi:hypothetical protein